MEKTRKNYKEFIVPGLIILAFLTLVILTRKSLFPVILSAAFAYILYPIIKFFEVRGIKRLYTVIGLYIVAGIFIFLGIYFITQLLSFEVSKFQSSWAIYAEKIKLFLVNADRQISGWLPFASDLKFAGKINSVLSELPQVLIGFMPALTYFFLIPFITFFMLLGGPEIVDYALDHVPSRYIEVILHILSRIDTSLGNYMRGITTEAFIIFSIAFVGLMLMQLNYAVIIAIIIGISSLVPYLGAFVGALISSVVAYFQFDGFIYVFNMLLFFGTIRFVDDWFLQPFIMKKAVELNPVIVVFALMAGFEIGGIWGVIFSIPITCILKDLLQIALELQETEFMWKPKPHTTRISIPYT